MAQYDQLPVFKASYDLLQEVYRVTGNVPRDLRYTLLQDVKRALTGMMVNIYKANRRHDKQPYIEAAMDQLIEARLQLRLMKDLRSISLKAFARLSLKSEEVSKQLTGWLNYAESKSADKSPSP